MAVSITPNFSTQYTEVPSVPHPIFAIVLVGEDEIPFGIQKDLLISHSPYFRAQFEAQGPEQALEQITRLPDTTPTVFGCFQNYIFTNAVYDRRGGIEIPDYPILFGIWTLATKLQMPHLKVAVLETMTELRALTGVIPSPKLIEQAWKETEEQSGLRKMLITWAAEHMRSNPPDRNEFVHALPPPILQSLVLKMSDMTGLPSAPPVHRQRTNHVSNHQQGSHAIPMDVDYEHKSASLNPPKRRKTENSMTASLTRVNPMDEAFELKPTIKKPPRKSEPIRRPSTTAAPRRVNATPDIPITPEADLASCRTLIGRMLSAPSYWTRYVKSFRDPVDPAKDHVPNYFDVVKRPMCLTMIKDKMDRNEYKTADEFERDVRQIFQNAYEYWTREDEVFKECERFEGFFNNQWMGRHGKGRGGGIKSEVLED